MNKLLIGEFRNDPDFIRYPGSFGGRWSSRNLVGLTSAGLLYVDERIIRLTSYEYPAKLLPWKNITQVQTRSKLGIEGIVGGLVSLCVGGLVFWGGWITRELSGVGTVVVPVLGVVFGLTFVLGARRNLIEASTAERSLRWVSPPLAYRATVLLCKEVVEYCRINQVPTESHVEGGFCCHRCGYYLIGSTSGVCPECGTGDARFQRPQEERGRPVAETVASYELSQFLDMAQAPPRPVTVLGVIFALASATLWWVPVIGMVIAIVAVTWNRRVTKWVRAASWVGFGLALVVTGCFVALILMEHRW